MKSVLSKAMKDVLLLKIHSENDGLISSIEDLFNILLLQKTQDSTPFWSNAQQIPKGVMQYCSESKLCLQIKIKRLLLFFFNYTKHYSKSRIRELPALV